MVSLFPILSACVYKARYRHDLLHDLCSHKQGHSSGWIMVLFNGMTLEE